MLKIFEYFFFFFLHNLHCLLKRSFMLLIFYYHWFNQDESLKTFLWFFIMKNLKFFQLLNRHKINGKKKNPLRSAKTTFLWRTIAKNWNDSLKFCIWKVGEPSCTLMFFTDTREFNSYLSSVITETNKLF